METKAKERAGKGPARTDGPQPKVVEAEAFVVRDAAGRERGRFGVADKTVELVLYAPEGERRIVLQGEAADDDFRIRLALLDDGGVERVGMSYCDELGASFNLIDVHERVRMLIGTAQKGRPLILLTDHRERERARLELAEDGTPTFRLSDADEKPIAQGAPDWIRSVRHTVLTGQMTDLPSGKLEAEPDPTRRALLISAQNLMGELGDAWPSLSTTELALFVADLGRVVGPSVPPAMAR